MSNNTLTGFTVSLDGYGYAGTVQSHTPPAVEMVVQEHTAGGLAGTDEILMNKVASMEATTVIKTHDEKLSSVLGRGDVSQKVRGNLKDEDGNDIAVMYEYRGRVTRIEEAEMSGGDGEHTITYRQHITKYTKSINGVPVFSVDIKAVSLKPDGKTDTWEQYRKNLGIG
ncbi:phage major tail tube protein [Sansalvadorimonas verongulae]|uniref:phage major tail tube protein n=1 Tax=Sansalvadorimonas verongulae TaxID=2172824 RepID=UPI0012BCCAA2|nr:phage major tail tube protein [Sansalvadorimonas verongulae]MTI13426.1 hypothetical protein [Sansalvadorimonas verongulae]